MRPTIDRDIQILLGIATVLAVVWGLFALAFGATPTFTQIEDLNPGQGLAVQASQQTNERLTVGLADGAVAFVGPHAAMLVVQFEITAPENQVIVEVLYGQEGQWEAESNDPIWGQTQVTIDDAVYTSPVYANPTGGFRVPMRSLQKQHVVVTVRIALQSDLPSAKIVLSAIYCEVRFAPITNI